MVEETVLDTDEKLSPAEETATVDGGEADVAKADDEKQTPDPYEEKLKELEKYQEMVRQKEGALKEERRKRKEAEAKLKEHSDEEPKEKKYLTAEELEERLNKERLNDKLEKFTSNTNEQKLIRHHYENSIVKTGDLAADLEMAAAIANQHLIKQVKAQETERMETESYMAKASIGGTYNRSGAVSDPAQRAVEALLKKLGAEDAIKHVGK